MPSFPIVDSHVHLYDPTAISYGWLRSVPQVDRAHAIADFDAARGAALVKEMLFVEVAPEAGEHMREARFAMKLVQSDARLGALIVHAPLE
jgi:L-fuconolactonase